MVYNKITWLKIQVFKDQEKYLESDMIQPNINLTNVWYYQCTNPIPSWYNL